MGRSVIRQLITVLLSIAAGVSLGFVYDLLRLVRYDGNKRTAFLTDALFAAMTAAELFMICIIFGSSIWVYLSVGVGCCEYLVLTKGAVAASIGRKVKKAAASIKKSVFHKKISSQNGNDDLL